VGGLELKPGLAAYGELVALLLKAAGLNGADYTPASWGALQAVVAEGWDFVGGRLAVLAAGGDAGLEPLVDLQAEYVDLLRRLQEAIASLVAVGDAPPPPPASVKAISAGIHAADETLYVDKAWAQGNDVYAAFQVKGEGVADVGALNFRVSYPASALEDLDPATGITLSEGVAGATLRYEKTADPIADGYVTYSVYVLAEDGGTVTVADGDPVIDIKAKLKSKADPQVVTALLSHFDAVYYDASYEGGEVGIDADAAIYKAAATETVRFFVKYDVNHDGQVTLADVNAVRQCLGEAGAGGWANDLAKACDVTGEAGEPDGAVDLLDLTVVIAAYEATIP